MKKLWEWIYDHTLWYLYYWYKEVRYELRSAWQRVFRGYDDSAWWGHCHWFLETAPKAIRKLRDEGYGHPAALTNRKWKSELTKMANHFEKALYYDGNWTKKNEGMAKKELEKGMKLYTKYFFNLWD